MFQKVSVLIPTRHRVQRLRTLIPSFDQTTGNGPAADLVFRVDEDDPETYTFLQAWGGHKIIVGPRYEGYKSMPRFFNELAEHADGDVLMCGNDDMVFRTPGWADMILAAANRFPDGLFDLGVSTLNETHYPFATISRKAVERMGFFWDPRIFWGDIFLRDTMRWFDRCVMVPEVRIDHDWAGFPYDVLHQDPRYWTTTHAQAVQEAADKLRSLL